MIIELKVGDAAGFAFDADTTNATTTAAPAAAGETIANAAVAADDETIANATSAAGDTIGTATAANYRTG